MDDITPGMDWDKFLRFKEICDRHEIKPLIGIVPENKDSMLNIDEPREDFWDYVASLKSDGWIIAQHGETHVYATNKKGCFPLNALSEFAGKSYEEQFEAIKRGKQILEQRGIYTDFFMAPAHSYDKNTLKALKNLNFKNITDGFGKMPYSWKNITFYPISFKQESSLKKNSGYTTFVVHTNTMNDRDFERYERLFEKQRDSFISYGEYMAQKPENRNALGHFKEYVMAYIKYILVLVRAKRLSGK